MRTGFRRPRRSSTTIGGVAWDEPIDTGVDGVGVAPFNEVVAAAEVILLDADAIHADPECGTDLAEAINDAGGT